MKTKCLLLLFASLILAGHKAFAQSEQFNVVVDVTKPTPTCTIDPIADINFGTVTIPWTGSNSANGSTTATVTYVNTTSIVASLDKTNFYLDAPDNKVQVNLTLTPTSVPLTGSSSPQQQNFSIDGTVTVFPNATPNTYSDVVTFSVTCSN